MDDRIDSIQLARICTNQRIDDPEPASRGDGRLNVLPHGEENAPLLKGTIEGLVLASQNNAVELEPDVIALRRRPATEAAMEDQANLALADNMNVPFEIVAWCSALPLNKNAVTYVNLSVAIVNNWENWSRITLRTNKNTGPLLRQPRDCKTGLIKSVLI